MPALLKQPKCNRLFPSHSLLRHKPASLVVTITSTSTNTGNNLDAMTGASSLESTAALRNAPGTSAMKKETIVMTGADQNQGAMIGVSLSGTAVTSLAVIGVTIDVTSITAACGVSAEAAQPEMRKMRKILRIKKKFLSLNQR